MSYIDIRHVWQTYGDHVVLENLTLSVNEGEFCTLVGASGCGKSTFLRLLLGQERPSKGRLLLAGKPLPAEPDANRGVVFQRYSVFPHLSVLDNVALGRELPRAPLWGRLFGAAKRRARDEAAQLLERVGLSHALQKYPHQLSGGMQQRLAIAQALIARPRMLLLDEPFGALDALTRGTIQDELMAIVRETHQTVFMITHDVDESILLADRILLMSNGSETSTGYVPGGIAEVVTNPLPRQRTRASLHHLDGYYDFRNHIVDFLVTRATAH